MNWGEMRFRPVRRALLVIVAGPLVGGGIPLGVLYSGSAGAESAGYSFTVAGGPGAGIATSVAIFPFSVAVGPDGRELIVDLSHGVVRELDPKTDQFRVVAGDGIQGISGDGGPAIRAELDAPTGVANGAGGDLAVAEVNGPGDFSAPNVRFVAGKTGTFFGQAMTAGDIYTVAGTACRATRAMEARRSRLNLNEYPSLAFDAFGNLVIADGGNYRGPGGGEYHRLLLWTGHDSGVHLHRCRQRRKRICGRGRARDLGGIGWFCRSGSRCERRSGD